VAILQLEKPSAQKQAPARGGWDSVDCFILGVIEERLGRVRTTDEGLKTDERKCE
jgi:hypothetical protein